MSFLLFVDESGHDHRTMPYEVRGGWGRGSVAGGKEKEVKLSGSPCETATPKQNLRLQDTAPPASFQSIPLLTIIRASPGVSS